MKKPRGSYVSPHTFSRRSALFSLFAAPVLRAVAQEPEKPTFSTNVKVINVFATVRDKDGRFVRDLGKEEFTLLEDGRPQRIRYFAQQTDLPLIVGLLVDTSGSERRMINVEREATAEFLRQVLRPDRDKAFLIHFDQQIELLQDLTSSRERLENALALLQIDDGAYVARTPQGGGSPSPGPGYPGGGYPGGGYPGGGYPGGGYPGGGGYPRGRGGWGGSGGGWGGGRAGGGHRTGGGTAFYDAIYLGSDEIMKTQQGRKAFIMLTDGEDNASKVSLQEAITTTQRTDTLAYSIRISDDSSFSAPFGGSGMGRRGPWGRGGHMSHSDGKQILQEISRKTGGSYFEVSNNTSVEQIYGRIEEELRNQYSIGYTSDQPESAAYRKIHVATKRKGLTVQAREGYYASST
jgi:Mg-chelatase subunit ChlD